MRVDGFVEDQSQRSGGWEEGASEVCDGAVGEVRWEVDEAAFAYDEGGESGVY